MEVFRDVLLDGGKALAGLSSQSLNRRLHRLARGMLQHGTVTAEARAGYSLEESGILKVLRVQNENGHPLDLHSTLLLQLPQGHGPGEWAQYVSQELLPTVRRRRMARFVDLEYDMRYLPEAVAGNILKRATELGFCMKIHSDLFAHGSAVAAAVAHRAISCGHLSRITRDEIDALAASETIAILNPGRAQHLGGCYAAPGRLLADTGVIPSLVSGYHPELSPSLSMQTAIYLACRSYRFRAEEAICAATINNAFALRAEATIGSIEAGKQADLLVLHASDYRELAHSPGVNIVDKTIKRGKLVYDSKSAMPGDDD